MADDHHPPASADQIEDVYHPKDAIGAALKATAITTSFGLFVSAIQNTLTRQNVGAMGTFTRYGSTTAVFGRFSITGLAGEGEEALG
jgi:hypothetical protein